MNFRARDVTWSFPRPTLLMGILNVTPDSFSDGGRFFDPAAAVRRGLELEAEGADIIDVGGESTRPQARPVSEEEELRRVLPVIAALAERTKAVLSIDTMKPAVARAAIAAGARIVNDVAANRSDLAMAAVVAETGAGYVLMHMQGTPATMQQAPAYDGAGVLAHVTGFFAERLGRLESAGVSREQVSLDVGIGFGKSLEHNLQLLAGLESLTRWGRPLLVGASRKSFLGHFERQEAGGSPEAALVGTSPGARLSGSLACACWAVHAGAQILRVHDLAATREAVRVLEAIHARKRQ